MSLQTLQSFQQAQCAKAPVVIGSRWFQRLTFGNGRSRGKQAHEGCSGQEAQYGTTKNCHKKGARVIHLVVQDLSQNKPTNDAIFNIYLFRSSKHVHAQNRGNIVPLCSCTCTLRRDRGKWTANGSNILKQHGNMIQHIDKKTTWKHINCCLDVSRTSHWNTSYITAWTNRKKQDMIAWAKEEGRDTIDKSRWWTGADRQDMIDKTRWPLNADLFPEENMSMTSEMVHGTLGRRTSWRAEKIWNETTSAWRHVCVHTSTC